MVLKILMWSFVVLLFVWNIVQDTKRRIYFRKLQNVQSPGAVMEGYEKPQRVEHYIGPGNEIFIKVGDDYMHVKTVMRGLDELVTKNGR